MVAEEMNDNEVKEEEDKGKKKKVTEEEMKMAKDHGAEALKVVAKLHRQLGHPHNDKLVAALKDAKMHEKIIECARTWNVHPANHRRIRSQQNQHPYHKQAISTRHWRWTHSMSDGGVTGRRSSPSSMSSQGSR